MIFLVYNCGSSLQENSVIVCICIIKQLKYTTKNVSKIPVPQEQAYFRRLFALGNRFALGEELESC